MLRPGIDLLFSPYRLGKLELQTDCHGSPHQESRRGRWGSDSAHGRILRTTSVCRLIIAEATQICARAAGTKGRPAFTPMTKSPMGTGDACRPCLRRQNLSPALHVGRNFSCLPAAWRQTSSRTVRNCREGADLHRWTFCRCVGPRALEGNEIREIVEAYVVATRNALWQDSMELKCMRQRLPDRPVFARRIPTREMINMEGQLRIAPASLVR